MVFDSLFRGMAQFHVKHHNKFILLILAITVFMLIGMGRIYLETDFTKMMPQDNPAIMLKNRVSNTFSGQDVVFLLVKIDPESTSEHKVKDIRDPRVIQMLIDLTEEIEAQPSVDSVQSVGMAFSRGVPKDIDSIINVFKQIPQSSGFFNRDYTSTTVLVRSNVGSGTQKIISLMDDIDEDIKDTPKPPGVEIIPTGMPKIRVLIADILIRDAKFTILLSSLVILIVLIVVQRSLIQGYLVFNPLIFALIWTLGTMGWFNIPLSLPTAGIGAMILGLGVEYSIFFVSRYEEERKQKKNQEDSIYKSLSEVGTAIIGSSTTTIIGFLALLLSSMPMMHQLGSTLALGILYCVIGSLIINPSFIIFEENVMRKTINKMICNGAGEKDD